MVPSALPALDSIFRPSMSSLPKGGPQFGSYLAGDDDSLVPVVPESHYVSKKSDRVHMPFTGLTYVCGLSNWDHWDQD